MFKFDNRRPFSDILPSFNQFGANNGHSVTSPVSGSADLLNMDAASIQQQQQTQQQMAHTGHTSPQGMLVQTDSNGYGITTTPHRVLEKGTVPTSGLLDPGSERQQPRMTAINFVYLCCLRVWVWTYGRAVVGS